MRKINWLVIHTAATRPSMDIGVKEIRRWHKKRGFADIGYHYVIRRDGRVEKGRADTRQGAHVRGYNRDSLGISLAGGVNERTLKPENNYTAAQWTSLESLLRRLQAKHPQAAVRGHRDFPRVAKACPCFDAEPWARSKGFNTVANRKQWQQELKKSRTMVGASMAGVGTAGPMLQEASQQLTWIPGIPDWMTMVFGLLAVVGIFLTIYAKVTDAKNSPKYDNALPDNDSSEDDPLWDSRDSDVGVGSL